MQWFERYNCHWANVAPGLRLDVSWSSKGYTVQVFGRRTKKMHQDLDSAKDAACEIAFDILQNAIKKLKVKL